MPTTSKIAGDGEIAGELRLEPYAETSWRQLSQALPGATLYHRDRWITLLTRAYAFAPILAILYQHNTVVAAGVLARARLSGRFISLPFSDRCPPLFRWPEAGRDLLQALVAQPPAPRAYEIRGIAGPPPWETVECFVSWSLNLARPLAHIEKTLSAGFRRNLRRASRLPIAIERGSSSDLLQRFYAMQLESRRRLGLPPQPRHFFELAREIFAPSGNFEVWVARERGRDMASAVLLRDGDVVHYKWGARRATLPSLANHLLFWSVIEEFAPRARALDLGRTDVRNQGLMRFKKELGAGATALPSAFYPRAPRQISAESLTGAFAIAARIWRRLPIFATELGGRILYRFLA